jgi:hypothetical protein
MRLALVGLVILAAASPSGQSKPNASIQGVWQWVEVNRRNPNPPKGALQQGIHTTLQPGLLIFTNSHYAIMYDTAAKPRPTTEFKDARNPTAEELESQWGPFTANAGTYELNGDQLTLHVVVAKVPANQASGDRPNRYTVSFDGEMLILNQTENQGWT